ncbi:MAG: hypothetical protein ISP56_04980 [Flavobacteriaceae bacterium]|nr:hypothetical protein [Flavobacteriaceae bacterium]
MSFLKRLYFFLFGLGLVLIILVFITNKKGTKFNYMPNKRVVNDIYKKKWIFNDSNNKISKEDFITNFDVDFSLSNVKLDSCKIYYVHHKREKFNVINCEKKALFKKIN